MTASALPGHVSLVPGALLLTGLTAVLLAGCGGEEKAVPPPTFISQSVAPTGAEVPWWQVTPPSAPRPQTTTSIPAETLFEPGSWTLSPQAKTVLDKIAKNAAEGDGVKIIVSAHTDSDGEPDYNQDLSEKRATAVAAWLGQHGVSKKQIIAKGWGETLPLAPNTSTENKAKNRRVEITVKES
ncbi:OmpA family protein [Streptosporangium carneum]|uniref:OmpA-like domain-containing protein n=1 Tax=Streptosporangium carneum TaxID=47481 RepID=A0A9W6I5I0_9ACTN|nr:OmpA family protein [Streptosporangium carneum]GLK12082.1 hypothetical protein GCM10017600_54900 [Streptosporangium carneum]